MDEPVSKFRVVPGEFGVVKTYGNPSYPFNKNVWFPNFHLKWEPGDLGVIPVASTPLEAVEMLGTNGIKYRAFRYEISLKPLTPIAAGDVGRFGRLVVCRFQQSSPDAVGNWLGNSSAPLPFLKPQEYNNDTVDFYSLWDTPLYKESFNYMEVVHSRDFQIPDDGVTLSHFMGLTGEAYYSDPENIPSTVNPSSMVGTQYAVFIILGGQFAATGQTYVQYRLRYSTQMWYNGVGEVLPHLLT